MLSKVSQQMVKTGTELIRTGKGNASKQVAGTLGHKEKEVKAATGTLANMIGQNLQSKPEVHKLPQAIKIAAPTVSLLNRTEGQATITGMEGLRQQMSLSQHPTVQRLYHELGQQHVSASPEKNAGVDNTSGFSFSSDKGFDVMLEVSDVEQKDEQQDAEVQGKFVEMAHTAMMNAAQQDRNIGNTQMTAAISGGALQATTSLGGAFQQMKGLNTKSMSIKTELSPQAGIKMGAAGLSHELRGMNKPVFSSENVSPVKIQRDTGETTNYEITDHGDGLSSDHAKVLNEDAPGFQHRDDKHGIRHEQNQIKASRYQLKGELINTGGTIGKNLIEGASAQQQGNYHAEQKLAESAQQTAMAVANARNEAMHRDLDNTQKAIEAAKGQISNDNAVASQVAGNIRA